MLNNSLNTRAVAGRQEMDPHTGIWRKLTKKLLWKTPQQHYVDDNSSAEVAGEELETAALHTCTVRAKLSVWIKRELQWTLQTINGGRHPLQTLMFIVSNFMNSAVWGQKSLRASTCFSDWLTGLLPQQWLSHFSHLTPCESDVSWAAIVAALTPSASCAALHSHFGTFSTFFLSFASCSVDRSYGFDVTASPITLTTITPGEFWMRGLTEVV